MRDGDISFVGASALNNGITRYIQNDKHLHQGNTITVSYNGSVGESFYQDTAYWASDDVNVLVPKFEMTRHVAMFIASSIRIVGKRYEFIDKWVKNMMERDKIQLPAKGDGPDWGFMESYMVRLENIAEQRPEILARQYDAIEK